MAEPIPQEIIVEDAGPSIAGSPIGHPAEIEIDGDDQDEVEDPPGTRHASPVPPAPIARENRRAPAVNAPEVQIARRGEPRLIDRCAPCIARGRTSKCNRARPACSRCVKDNTQNLCFEGPPPPPHQPEEIQPAPELPLPVATPIQPRARTPVRTPIPLASSPGDRPQPRADPEPRRAAAARSRSASPIHGRGMVVARIRQRSPISFGARLQAAVPEIQDDQQKIRDEIKEMEEKLERAKARMMGWEGEANGNQVIAKYQPAVLGGLNVGRIQAPGKPRGEIARGVVADAEFSFIAPNVVELFRKGHGNTYISLVYLTDSYNKQSNSNAAITAFRSYIDPFTGKNVIEAAPLPDLNEPSMTYVDYVRAYQRFIAILDAIEHPMVDLWRAHGHHVQHHPALTTNWPLILSYCIAIRRRAVYDHALDVSVFQSKIFDHCRAEQQEKAIRDIVHIGPSRAAPSRTTQTPTYPAAADRSPAVQRPKSDRSNGICFACKGVGHLPKECRGRPVLATKDRNGDWLVNETMSAPCAEIKAIPRSHAPVDPRKIVTPLVASEWERLLSQTGALSKFQDIPSGLINGLGLGVSPSPLLSTTIHANHKSATDRPEIITKHIAKEMAAGRYSGPYSPSELHTRIGHFRASPLGVVDKPSAPGEFRIIQDFSFSSLIHDVASVNSEINASDFSCEWGFFPDVVKIMLNLPAGAQAATFDVDAAYRRIPVKVDDQVHTVIHWEGKCWIDHCVPFGATSSGGLFGRFGDALASICGSLGYSPVLKWVDDFLFFRVPIGGTSPLAFGYSESEIYALAATLGIPWKLAKTMPFAELFRYIGFNWDISSKQVSIPPEKRLKFANKLSEWLQAPTVNLKTTESLLGSLAHCAWAVPEGRSRLVGLSRFLASFPHNDRSRFISRKKSERATSDAVWWANRLATSPCGSILRPPPPESNLSCYTDASTSFGVSIVIDNAYAMWRLGGDWKASGRDIGWAEIIAVELALSAIILNGTRKSSITIHCDNQGVVGALKSGRSHNDQQNIVLQRIMATAFDNEIHLTVTYVASADNPADAPSRGIKPLGYVAMRRIPRLDESIVRWLKPDPSMYTS